MAPDEFAEAVENIERIAALSLAPDDIVWIRCTTDLTAEEAARIHATAKSVFGDHKVIVTPPSLDIDLIDGTGGKDATDDGGRFPIEVPR